MNRRYVGEIMCRECKSDGGGQGLTQECLLRGIPQFVKHRRYFSYFIIQETRTVIRHSYIGSFLWCIKYAQRFKSTANSGNILHTNRDSRNA